MSITIESSLIDVDLLPPRMQELAALIGIEPTIALCNRHPGQVIYIPEKAIAGHELGLLIGGDNFALLCKTFGPDKAFYIPKVDKVEKQMKYHAAKKMRTQNKSASEIARATGYSHRHTVRILNKRDSNRDLFE